MYAFCNIKKLISELEDTLIFYKKELEPVQRKLSRYWKLAYESDSDDGRDDDVSVNRAIAKYQWLEDIESDLLVDIRWHQKQIENLKKAYRV